MSKGENFDFFPKYTTVMYYSGSYTFYSDPWEVVPYNEISVEVFIAGMTTAATFWAELEESNDLEQWSGTGGSGTSQLTSAGSLATLTASDTARFVRLTLHTFTAPSVPDYFVLWAKGVARNA